MIIQECDDVLSLVAAVESGRGLAVVGDFITAVVGDYVRFVPFTSGAHSLEVGLLYRQGRVGENVQKLVVACQTLTRQHVSDRHSIFRSRPAAMKSTFVPRPQSAEKF